ncbi:MAG TPA: hypothetical protein VEX63_11545 [Flavisolibacter sp.]|jgi:hypothetical protein|nr:hypothetical protein [Flavisolibacter sp.]
MKNKRIAHARREVKIYEDYYKPSLSFSRFFKSIFGLLFFGRTSVAHSYVPTPKRTLK